MGPLDGLSVVDFTELGPGPLFTQCLNELGATVTKVERPGGDRVRQFSPGGHVVLNAGKSTIQVDLKRPGAAGGLKELIAGADVLAEGYRPGVLARLGLGYETLAELNPRLVYVSVSGYGQTGPLADDPGHDLNYLAASGLLAMSGGAERPPSIGIGVPMEFGSSLYALGATLAAVISAGKTGRGQHLDVSITDCMIHWTNPTFAAYQHDGLRGLDAQRAAAFTKPAYAPFQTSDGKWIAIAAMEEHFWLSLADALGLDLTGIRAATRAERVANARAINAAIATAVAALTADEAVTLLRGRDVPVSPMVEPDELTSHPHGIARDLWAEAGGVRYATFPVKVRGAE